MDGTHNKQGVAEKAGEERSMIATIKGVTEQMDWSYPERTLLITVIEGTVRGRGTRGRPRQMLLD